MQLKISLYHNRRGPSSRPEGNADAFLWLPGRLTIPHLRKKKKDEQSTSCTAGEVGGKREVRWREELVLKPAKCQI